MLPVMPDAPDRERFDAGFYRRHYRDAQTRVVTQREMRRRAEFVAAFVRHAQWPVRSILDVGCGLGLMRSALVEQFPRARYTGLEVSQYLCDRYGWICASAADYRPARPYDLVICYDVLQYLPLAEARAALRNLARLCRGVLHFGALTTEDWRYHCDRRLTDRNVHLRSADWYRRRLAGDFLNAGSGMLVRKGAPIHLWELERAARPVRAR